MHKPTKMIGALGQWCRISGSHLLEILSKEEGLTTLKHTRNTSVCKIKGEYNNWLGFTGFLNDYIYIYIYIYVCVYIVYSWYLYLNKKHPQTKQYCYFSMLMYNGVIKNE